MKIFFCFLSSFFIFFSLQANAVQWIYGTNTETGSLPMPIITNEINWVGTGSTYQVGALSSETYNSYNLDSTGCPSSGSNGSYCRVGVKFGQFRFSGGVIQFNLDRGTQPIGNTGGSKCYLTSVATITGSTGFSGSDLHETMRFNSPQWAVNDSGWIEVNGACRDLMPSSPSISQLSIVVPEISGYIPLLVSGTTLAPREWSYFGGGDVLHSFRGFTTSASIKPIARIIACGEAKYTNTCAASWHSYSPLAINPNVPDVNCDVIVPKEIIISDVTTNDFIGKKGSDNIYAQCSAATTLSFQMVNNGIVKVGPFNVTTLIDNQSSPKLIVSESGININMSAEIKGNTETVEAGNYENSVIIIMDIS
ncbi:hypothetical protein N0398_03325 [Providencia rettgeri]|nr:hypothetical protein [Providencia rettgeri]